MATGNGTMLVLKSLAWLRVPQGGGVGERKRRRTTMFRRKAAGSGTMLVLKSMACRSTTKASRNFLVGCRRCDQAMRGNYGTPDQPPAHVQARQALATFCLDRTSQGAGSV